MDTSLNVVIVVARCSRTKKVFGIRFEEQSRNQWLYDWAFQITDEIAKNEGYDDGQVKGTISMSNKYPGCPYCNNKGFILCGVCEKVTCYNWSKDFACTWPSCRAYGDVIEVGSGFITKLDGSRF